MGKANLEKNIWAILRLSLGWIFLWAFLDKVFGLGFTTASDAAWLMGGSPTAGFLEFATKGPFAEFFQGLAGSQFIDCLFMIGLFAIGSSLMLGIKVRLASFFGILMLMLMYTSAIPPEHNPLVDDHIIYSLVLVLFFFVPVGDYWGFGERWSRISLVQRFPILK